MTFLRLYLRVLELIGREARLGWVLAIANVALAGAIFVEPILFGRIVDTLANAQGHLSDLSWPLLLTLVGAWTGFGLFSILCGALVALHADRLAHRQRQVVMTSYFELTELHIHPRAQGRGLGEALARRLLSERSEANVLLSTPETVGEANRAWRLYRRLGFLDVIRGYHFTGDPRAFAILGRQLPL